MPGIMEALGLKKAAEQEPTVEAWRLEDAAYRLETANENLARLQLMYEDAGWESLTAVGQREFTREGLTRNADLCRVMFVANPLMKRGLGIRASYVFGQGVEINARATGDDGEQDVESVVQAFLDDEGNRDAVTGAQARISLENDLGTDGNVFLAHFTNPLTGRVKVRPLPFDEIVEIISEPGDKTTPWFYRRRWVETTLTNTFGSLSREYEALYPALKYQPLTKPKSFNGVEVRWESPVLHVKVNPYGSKVWGVGDGFAALPWCRSYKEFLEDWATLCRALSRIAFRASSSKAKASQVQRAGLEAINKLGAGSSVSLGEGQTLEAVPKTGATLDSESGRPLAAMAAAAFGVNVTILLADPGVTGSRATAETLDLPQRLELMGRQEVWAQAYRASCGYVIEQAVIAPRGPLKGTVERDGDRLLVDLGDTDPTVEVIWPDLEEVPVDTLMQAIERADGMDVLPPVEKFKLVLRALRVRDIDDLLESMVNDAGEFIPPSTGTDAAAGNLAAQAFRDGKDPGAALK
ncbi:hypothetical protein [Paenarthrobacter sp. Y-19]|uniref:hypothetical protein n=1 Tax=Paenarthrobacter sp. Y-19 TaxID=3031125 RepID=UPI0023DA4D05|nr:hypothetical protein [Paenarthrobacter sp. Y-19]